jgi:hypothetical protein
MMFVRLLIPLNVRSSFVVTEDRFGLVKVLDENRRRTGNYAEYD